LILNEEGYRLPIHTGRAIIAPVDKYFLRTVTV